VLDRVHARHTGGAVEIEDRFLPCFPGIVAHGVKILTVGAFVDNRRCISRVDRKPRRPVVVFRGPSSR
jgi:hypothetical protein